MKKILIMLAIAGASFSGAAAAQCTSSGCVSTISSLYTNAEGNIYVGTPLDETVANCTPVSNVYFTLNPNAANADEIYSSLLAAYMSQKKIQVRIRDGHAKCEIAYVNFDVNH